MSDIIKRCPQSLPRDGFTSVASQRGGHLQPRIRQLATDVTEHDDPYAAFHAIRGAIQEELGVVFKGEVEDADPEHDLHTTMYVAATIIMNPAAYQKNASGIKTTLESCVSDVRNSEYEIITDYSDVYDGEDGNKAIDVIMGTSLGKAEGFSTLKFRLQNALQQIDVDQFFIEEGKVSQARERMKQNEPALRSPLGPGLALFI